MKTMEYHPVLKRSIDEYNMQLLFSRSYKLVGGWMVREEFQDLMIKFRSSQLAMLAIWIAGESLSQEDRETESLNQEDRETESLSQEDRETESLNQEDRESESLSQEDRESISREEQELEENNQTQRDRSFISDKEVLLDPYLYLEVLLT